ncbi:MAG: HD domain-containing protein [archaeon]
MSIIEESRKFAVTKYGPDPMTGYPHAMRVIEHVKWLSRLHSGNEELLEISAIFHDIAFDGKNIATHSVESANICDTFLRDQNYPAVKRNRIAKIIKRHTIRDWTIEGKPESSEDKILFDAEALERITMHGFLRFVTMSFRLPYNSTKEVINAAERFIDENYQAMFFDESKIKAQENYLLVKNAISHIKDELDIQ